MTRRVAVIGAGVIGLSAAWALERRGFACLVFEQSAPGGSQSAGESRIFRHAHADQRQFELALESRRGWQEWEEEFGVQLISSDGAMVIGEEAVGRLSRYADDPGIAVRELAPDQIGTHLPLLAGFSGPAMIDEMAGAIRSQLALANLIGSVGLNLVPERILSVSPRPQGGVEVTSEFGSRNFDSVVVAAGTGTASLAAGNGIDIPLSERAHVRMTMPIQGGGYLEKMACLQDSSGAFGEAAAYGSPVRANRHYAVGLAETVRIDPEDQDPDPLGPLSNRTREYISRALPGLESSEAVPLQRWVTELPWAADGLGIWQAGDAFFIAGHNMFKLAPALGNALARAVVTGSVGRGFRPEDRLGLPDGSPATEPAS